MRKAHAYQAARGVLRHADSPAISDLPKAIADRTQRIDADQWSKCVCIPRYDSGSIAIADGSKVVTHQPACTGTATVNVACSVGVMNGALGLIAADQTAC